MDCDEIDEHTVPCDDPECTGAVPVSGGAS
jgi:hypothetical protein